ncbi:hypothetical protein ACFFS4_06310 [Kutzneria kofuensis]|uniref:Uncharacterized protein n=1 Tax=Kutzneria kofuensis TaxID=103725 RepID=A0A7W9KJF9_9PSEU|nr:hypothetical protein [Kutzneria kofuensis]MBB5893717.1 hypothetical protein [Kutzneria kofuensis]
MPKTVVGLIAATLVAAVLGVSGVAQASTPTLAQQVQQGRDRIAAAWQAKDVDAVRAAVTDLAPALAQVRKDVDREAMNPAVALYLGRAEQQRIQLADTLATPQPRSGILDSVSGLVSGLLDSLSGLLSGLLGGGGHDSDDKPTAPAPAAA